MPAFGMGAGGGPGGLPGFGTMPGLGQGQGADVTSLMQVQCWTAFCSLDTATCSSSKLSM